MGQCAYRGCEDRYTRRVPAPGPGNQTLDVCTTHARLLEDMMKKLCLVTGCDQLHAGKGFCNRHYGRFYSHGLVPEAGVSTHAEADAVQAAWVAKRAEAETAKGAGKSTKAPPRGKAPAVQPPAKPVQLVPEEVIGPPKVPRVLRELPDAPSRAKIAKLEAQVRELSAARDRLAEDAKTLREENRRLIAESAPPQRPDPTAMDWRDDALEGAKKDRDQYAEDLRVASAKLQTANRLITDQDDAIKRMSTIEAQLRAEIATLRGLSDVVRPAPAPAPIPAASRLATLVRKSGALRQAIADAIREDVIDQLSSPDSQDQILAELIWPKPASPIA